MRRTKLGKGETTLTAIVPESLHTFITNWSKDGGHDFDQTVRSLFSHGLVSFLAVNDYHPELVAVVNPILDELVKAAPTSAHVIEICMRGSSCEQHGSSSVG